MNRASTQVGIAWTTRLGAPGARVRYGTRTGRLTESATGRLRRLGPKLGTMSEVTLTGLTPSTTYFYRAGGSRGGWSKEYSFRTAPPDHARCGRQRFVVMCDSRGERGGNTVSGTWPRLLRRAMQFRPLFLLHTGDMLHDGSKAWQWPALLRATAPFGARLPMMFAIGNHDDGPGQGDEANFNKLFHLPRSAASLGGSGTEDHYFFVAGHAIFVVLSTSTFTGGKTFLGAQAEWMDRVLSRHPRRWRFVALHYPIYTEHRVFNHRPNELGQNAALVPVLNRHHVDVVFQGHNRE